MINGNVRWLMVKAGKSTSHRILWMYTTRPTILGYCEIPSTLYLRLRLLFYFSLPSLFLGVIVQVAISSIPSESFPNLVGQALPCYRCPRLEVPNDLAQPVSYLGDDVLSLKQRQD